VEREVGEAEFSALSPRGGQVEEAGVVWVARIVPVRRDRSDAEIVRGEDLFRATIEAQIRLPNEARS
jgi:hypothetical protein